MEKERLVAASFAPNVSASEVARSAGIHVSQLFRWRKQLCERVGSPGPVLVPVLVVSEAPTPTAVVKPRRRSGMIEIGLRGGRRVRVDRDVDIDALRRVLDVLGVCAAHFSAVDLGRYRWYRNSPCGVLGLVIPPIRIA